MYIIKSIDGHIIDMQYTLYDAHQIVAAFEKADMEDGIYEDNYYVIVYDNSWKL